MARKTYNDPMAFARGIRDYHHDTHEKVDKIHKDSAIYFLIALNKKRQGNYPAPGFPVITNWMRSTMDVDFNQNWDTENGEPSIADPTKPNRKETYPSYLQRHVSKIRKGPTLSKINIAIKAFYARYVEDGTANMKPRQFMYAQLKRFKDGEFTKKAMKRNKWGT